MGEDREITKDFAEAASIQCKFANRIWLAVIIFALLILIPHDPNDPNGSLSVGSLVIPKNAFDMVAAYVLSVLVICFCQAHAQAHRVGSFSKKFLDQTPKEGIRGVDFWDFYDMLVTPTFNRVAPLSLIISPKWPRTRIVYYVLLKVISAGVYFVVPATALGIALYANLRADEISKWITYPLYPIVLVAYLALIQIIVREIVYARHVIPFIRKDKTSFVAETSESHLDSR